MDMHLDKVPLHVLQQKQERIEYRLDNERFTKRDIDILVRIHSEVTNEIIRRRKELRRVMHQMEKGVKL